MSDKWSDIKLLGSADAIIRFADVNTGPSELVFCVGDTWALKITKNGIVSNPDVPTDEGAKAIFDALKPYIENISK